MTETITSNSQEHATKDLIFRLWTYIWPGRRKKLLFLAIVMVAAAIAEIATLASIIPLVGTLLDPLNSKPLAYLAHIPWSQHLIESQHFHGILISGTILLVCAGAFLRVLVIHMTTQTSAEIGIHTSKLYFRALLNGNYESIVNESSSKKTAFLTNKIQFVINNYVFGILNLISSFVSAIAIIGALVWLSTGPILSALVALCSIYLLIAFVTRKKLKYFGEQISTYRPESVKCLQDGLGSIRDVLMSNSQEVFVERLGHSTRKVEMATAKVMFFGSFPRPVVEAICIVSIAIFAFAVVEGRIVSEEVIPALGVLSIGLIRLLPFVQTLFTQWSRMIHGEPVLHDLVKKLDDHRAQSAPSEIECKQIAEQMTFDSTVCLKHLGFHYKTGDKPSLHDINMKFNKGDRIGIAGTTGSGKSTLLDIVMGLLPPTEGQMLVDGCDINQENRISWRDHIAHVPQQIYIADSTMIENIAFAENLESIDQQRAQQCAEIACLHDYIQSLPEKYHSPVGEHGVRMSGGQRQRLGIARALYSNKDILVLDEATNALDADTEMSVLSNLDSAGKNLTLIMVSHNSDLNKHCNLIFRLENGRLLTSS